MMWEDMGYNLHNSVIGKLVQCSGRRGHPPCEVVMEIVRRREDGSVKEKLILYDSPKNSLAWDCHNLRTIQGQAIKEFMS